MEQTWYYFPGQEFGNTPIQDRGKALIATKEAWQGITAHLDRKRIQEELVQNEQDRRDYLKNASYEMVKNWDNSIEKIRQRRIENLVQKVEQREAGYYKRYLELRQEQAAERDQIVADARKKMYMHQEKSRNLNSALILSEVLFERNLQCEFEKNEREHELIEIGKYAKLIKYNAEQEALQNKEKKQKRKETDVYFAKELKKQIQKIENDAAKEKEMRLGAERKDNILAKEELETIITYEKQLDRAKKADVKQQFNEFAKIQAIYKQKQKEQEDAEIQIAKIYTRAKCKIDEKKKSRAGDERKKKLGILEKLQARLATKAANEQEIEEQILAKQMKEFDERAENRIIADEAHKEELKQDRINDRKEVVKRREKMAAEQREVHKWDFLDRLKANEMFIEHEKDIKTHEWEDKVRYKKQLDKQMEEIKVQINESKVAAREEFECEKQKLKDDDNKFFAYAQEVLNLAKNRGRNLDPINKVVHNYKKENNLEPKKKNLSQLKSTVPINQK